MNSPNHKREYHKVLIDRRIQGLEDMQIAAKTYIQNAIRAGAEYTIGHGPDLGVNKYK